MRPRWLAAAVLGIALTSAGTARANVLLIGDSIFWGLGAGGGTKAVAFQLQRELKDLYIFNYSAPGATMAGMFAPLPREAAYFGGIGWNVQLAVIGLGINDWRLNVPIDYFSAKYEEFVHDLQERVPKIACVAPLWSSRDNKRNAVGMTIDDYRRAIQRVCADKPGRYFWNAVAAIGNRHFLIDGLHPNRQGHRRYAKWLRDRVREVYVKPAAVAATRRAARGKTAPITPTPPG